MSFLGGNNGAKHGCGCQGSVETVVCPFCHTIVDEKGSPVGGTHNA